MVREEDEDVWAGRPSGINEKQDDGSRKFCPEKGSKKTRTGSRARADNLYSPLRFVSSRMVCFCALTPMPQISHQGESASNPRNSNCGQSLQRYLKIYCCCTSEPPLTLPSESGPLLGGACASTSGDISGGVSVSAFDLPGRKGTGVEGRLERNYQAKEVWSAR